MSFEVLFQKYIYRPQRSCGKVIFSQACVKNSVHRGGGVCLSACWDTHSPRQTPPLADTPWADTPRQTHPWADKPFRQTHPRRPLQQIVCILLECFLDLGTFGTRKILKFTHLHIYFMTDFPLTLARWPMAGEHCQQTSGFLSYWPRLASGISSIAEKSKRETKLFS